MCCFKDDDNRKKEYEAMMQMDKEKIIRDYFIEKDCKNEAYEFILSCGYFEEYRPWHFGNK